MKKLIVSVLFFIFMLPAASFAAEPLTAGVNDVYVGPKLGLSWGRIHDTPSGFGNERYFTLNLGGFFGYNFSPVYGLPFRLEGDLTFRGGDDVDGRGSNKIELNSFTTLMANVWFDIPVNINAFQPYIGGGIGMGHAYFDARQGGNKDNDDSSWAFAWNLGGGAVYRFRHNMALDMGYRYVNAGKFDSDVSGPLDYEFKLTSHDLSAGLRFEF